MGHKREAGIFPCCSPSWNIRLSTAYHCLLLLHCPGQLNHVGSPNLRPATRKSWKKPLKHQRLLRGEETGFIQCVCEYLPCTRHLLGVRDSKSDPCSHDPRTCYMETMGGRGVDSPGCLEPPRSSQHDVLELSKEMTAHINQNT